MSLLDYLIIAGTIVMVSAALSVLGCIGFFASIFLYSLFTKPGRK